MLPSAHYKDVGVRIASLRSWIPAPPILCPRFVGSLTVATQDSRPSGSLSGRRRRAVALASVRRPNCPYTFRVGSFHEDVGFRDAIEGINQTTQTSPYSP